LLFLLQSLRLSSEAYAAVLDRHGRSAAWYRDFWKQPVLLPGEQTVPDWMPQDGSVQPYDSQPAKLTGEARAELAETETPGTALGDPVIFVDAPGSSIGQPQEAKEQAVAKPVSVPLPGNACRMEKSLEVLSF
jgi:hypothetical protein